jgi:hypothetical protein
MVAQAYIHQALNRPSQTHSQALLGSCHQVVVVEEPHQDKDHQIYIGVMKGWKFLEVLMEKESLRMG